jgi:glycosidase
MLGDDLNAAGFAAALLLTLPGIAATYYGDEVGMAGGDEPANRGGMAWDKSRQDAQTLALYQRLGALRREQPALRRGSYDRLSGEDDLVVFSRTQAGDRLVVVANAARRPVNVSRARLDDWLGGRPSVIASLARQSSDTDLGRQGLSIAGQSVVIVGRTS